MTGSRAANTRSEAPLLSVIVPAFNESERIGTTLESIMGYLGAQPYSWEVLVVDDGSSDGTAEIAGAISEADDRVQVRTVAHGGKGWAVKSGMLAAAGKYRFMCDADLSMPIDQLGAFLDRMDEGYDIVIGSRQLPGARRFGEGPGRHMRGRVFNWLVRLLAVRGYEDTQCGFKCFRGEVADDLFSVQRVNGLAFDVELLYLASRMGLRVLEMPIDWHHHRSSGVRPVADSFQMALDVVLLRLRDVRGSGYTDSRRQDEDGP